MKLISLLCVTLAITSSTAKRLIFEDTFSNGEIDESKWKFEQTLSGGGDWQFQWFVKDKNNAFVENSTLHLRPTLTSDTIGEAELFTNEITIPITECTSQLNYGCSRRGTQKNILNPIRSASIQSKIAFKYGVFDIRAKMPAGDWIRSYIKLIPKSNKYGAWPASGEAYLFESRGNRNLFNEYSEPVGIEQVATTLHFGPKWNINGMSSANFKKTLENSDFNEDFHNFKLDWSEEGMEFFIDGALTGKIKMDEVESFWKLGGFDHNEQKERNPWTHGSPMAPFDQEFYLVFGLAVGGISGFFSDSYTNRPYPKPWTDDSRIAPKTFWNAKDSWYKTWIREPDSSNFQIDYVRVYKK